MDEFLLPKLTKTLATTNRKCTLVKHRGQKLYQNHPAYSYRKKPPSINVHELEPLLHQILPNYIQQPLASYLPKFNMARHLLVTHSSPSVFQVTLAALTLLCCALSLFMCTSHSRKWRRRWIACTDFLVDDNNGLVVQHMEPAQSDDSMDDSSEQGDNLVWQKNILMGGKCQLPDFSGVIVYDVEGDIIKPNQTPRLTWK